MAAPGHPPRSRSRSTAAGQAFTRRALAGALVLSKYSGHLINAVSASLSLVRTPQGLMNGLLTSPTLCSSYS